MATDVNWVPLLGHIGPAPELRYLETGIGTGTNH